MTLQAILDKLVKEYENRKFFEAVNAVYRSMTSEEGEQELTERQEMDRLTGGDETLQYGRCGTRVSAFISVPHSPNRPPVRILQGYPYTSLPPFCAISQAARIRAQEG